ncbi:MAG: hypothetical protein JWQ61_135 [Collimonas fungivorans]|nr:hypothetical protein [Collimonas fungivorans]
MLANADKDTHSVRCPGWNLAVIVSNGQVVGDHHSRPDKRRIYSLPGESIGGFANLLKPALNQ